VKLLPTVATLAPLLAGAALSSEAASAQEINFDQINKFESLGTGTLQLVRHQKRSLMIASGTS
jgi:hypothetical protein